MPKLHVLSDEAGMSICCLLLIFLRAPYPCGYIGTEDVISIIDIY